MKIRTKFLAAALAATMTLGCALTASAFTTEPKLSLQGNESSPLTLKNQAASATLTLKASDFKEVKGAKITVELPDSKKMELTGITVSDVDSENVWKLDKDVNYKVSGNKITMVDVFNMGTGTTSKDELKLDLNFTVSGTDIIGKYKIKVSGDFADDEIKTAYTTTVEADALVIGREKTTVASDAIPADNKTFFIPYGGVSDQEKNSLDKDKSGKFDTTKVSGDVNILKCLTPAAGEVTTFGASRSTSDTTIQFGSYIDDTTLVNNPGTIVIASYDLSEALTNANYTKATYADAVAAFDGDANKLFADITEKFFTAEKADGKLHPYTYKGTNQVVYVAVVPQTKVMWKNTDGTKLQYAVRCTGIKDAREDKEFTAVGYVSSDSGYKFSEAIKTGSYQSLGE